LDETLIIKLFCIGSSQNSKALYCNKQDKNNSSYMNDDQSAHVYYKMYCKYY